MCRFLLQNGADVDHVASRTDRDDEFCRGGVSARVSTGCAGGGCRVVCVGGETEIAAAGAATATGVVAVGVTAGV